MYFQGLKQTYIGELIRTGINRREQPVTLTVDADHCLVDTMCFGSTPLSGSTSAFCAPSWKVV